jgi:hypothetical protein
MVVAIEYILLRHQKNITQRYTEKAQRYTKKMVMAKNTFSIKSESL